MRTSAETQERERRTAEQIAKQKAIVARGSHNNVIHTQSHEYGASTYPFEKIDDAMESFLDLVSSARDEWMKDNVNRTITLTVKVNRHTAR